MLDIELLKRIKKEKKLTYDEIAKLSKIPKTTVTNIFTGITGTPRIDTIQAIEKALGIDDEEERIKAIGGFAIPNDKYRIPLVGQVVCGKPIESPEYLEGYVYIEFKHPEEYFALSVKGDSMVNAGITPKSTLIIHRQSYAEDGDIVVACVNGESTTKRFKKQGDIVFLMPENQAYQPIIVTEKDNFYIFGKVVQIRTDC